MDWGRGAFVKQHAKGGPLDAMARFPHEITSQGRDSRSALGRCAKSGASILLEAPRWSGSMWREEGGSGCGCLWTADVATAVMWKAGGPCVATSEREIAHSAFMQPGPTALGRQTTEMQHCLSLLSMTDYACLSAWRHRNVPQLLLSISEVSCLIALRKLTRGAGLLWLPALRMAERSRSALLTVSGSPLTCT